MAEDIASLEEQPLIVEGQLVGVIVGFACACLGDAEGEERTSAEA